MKARILLMLLVMLAGANNAKAASTLTIGGQNASSMQSSGVIVTTIQVGNAQLPHLKLTNTVVSSADIGIAYASDGAQPLYITVNGICVIESSADCGLASNQRVIVQGNGSLYLKGTVGVQMQTTYADSLIVTDGVELICEGTGTSGVGIRGTGTNLESKRPTYYNSVSVSGSNTSLIVKGATKAMDIINVLKLNDGATIHNTDVSFSHTLNTTDWVHITATGLPIDEDHFPDENFRNIINTSTTYNPHADGYLSRYERSRVTSMDVASKSISDLTGVNYFTKLTSLNCRSNDLSSRGLDISALTKLQTLDASSNKLSTLNLENNTELQTLDVSSNWMTNLDLTHNTKLIKLTCTSTLSGKMESLDVSMCPDLETLDCSGWSQNSRAPLKSLNVTGCSKLKYLTANYTKLTSLDLTGCESLTHIYCSGGTLETLDLPELPNLLALHCYNNQLTSINVSRCTKLNTLFCYGNKLTSLDLSANSNVSSLDCSDNNQLVRIDVNGNKINSIKVSNCGALEEIHCYQNNLSETNLNNFITTLPTVATPSPLYLVSDDPGEHNACTAEQAFSIFSKGWKALRKVGDDWQLIPFEGEVTINGLQYKCIASDDGTLHADVIGVESLDAPTFAFADSVALSGNATPFPVTTIGRLAFKGVSYPNNITIPDHITTIEPLAFDSCRMTKFTIPPSVTNLCDSAFVRCNVLWDLYVRWPQPLPIAEGTDPFPNSKGGCVLHVPFGAYAYQTAPYWSQFKSVEMEGGEVVDEQGLKYKCYLNDNGEADHAEVSGWTAVQPPRDLVNIAESVTYEVNGVETAFTVTHIAPMAFASNTYIYIFVPATVQSIGNYSQTYRSVFGDKVPQFLVMKGTTPPSVKSANDFGSISSSDYLIVPQGSEAAYANASVWSRYQRHGIIDANGDYFYVSNNKATYFFTDRDTTTIRVPETITMNGVEYPVTAFQSVVFNPQTETIILHANFTDLANSSFYYLSNLKTVKVAWTEDIPTSTNISEVPIRQAVLIVPRGTKSLYANKRPWSYFSAIIELGDANADGVTDIADALDVVNYLLGLPTSETFRADLADANDDGQVTIADVTAIVAAIGGQ